MLCSSSSRASRGLACEACFIVPFENTYKVLEPYLAAVLVSLPAAQLERANTRGANGANRCSLHRAIRSHLLQVLAKLRIWWIRIYIEEDCVSEALSAFAGMQRKSTRDEVT